MKVLRSRWIFLFAVLMYSCGPSHHESSRGNTHSDDHVSSPEVAQVKGVLADSMLHSPEVTSIDIRTSEEISEGYIDGADLFMDFYDDFEGSISELDKNRKYLIYCRSGRRSSEAVLLLMNKGFRHVYNLEGGVDGWAGSLVQTSSH